MSETTGSATDLEDLLSKFLTWASGTPGWTVDDTIQTIASGRQLALHKGECYVQMRWNPTTSASSVVALYQSTGYSAATRAGTHTGDSGSGYNTNTTVTDTSLDNERCIETLGDGPFPSYYFYSNSGGDYLHCVVEVATDEFRHFGMGDENALERFGDWDTMDGGAYCYGHTGVVNSSAISGSQNTLFDGGSNSISGSFSQILRWATMMLSGAPGQDGSGEWTTVGGSDSFVQVNDTAGNPRARCIGGWRGGPAARNFGNYPASSATGLAPLTPVACWYINESPSPQEVMLLGHMADVRMVDLTYLAPKDTFTLGADTWRVFPFVRRAEGSSGGDTDFLGIAYKV